MSTHQRITPTQSLAMDLLKQMNPMPLPPLSEQPFVSILIANYNYGRYLSETLDSIFRQTYQNFEICICDDGSTDNSCEVIMARAAVESRIRHVFQANAGMACALNAAWSLCSGEIVCLIDADDVWMQDKLEKTIVSFRSHPAAGMSHHPLTQVRSDLQTVIREEFPPNLEEGWLGPQLLSGKPPSIATCSGLSVRRQVAEKCFPIDPIFRALADAVFREHATMVAPVVLIREALCLMRLHGANLTTTEYPASDLNYIEKNCRSMANLWNDRQSFAKERLGISVDQEPWHFIEGSHWFLAERLLRGKSLDRSLLGYIPDSLQRKVWRLLFPLPTWLRTVLFQLWWKPTIWKTAMKACLHTLRIA